MVKSVRFAHLKIEYPAMLDKFIRQNNIPKPTNFGKNIRFLRRVKGLSQAKLASELGLSRNNIASYETGTVEPNTAYFLKTCTYFSVDPRELLETVMVDQHPHSGEATMVHQYFADHMQAFTHQTNEMTKILEGYKVFYDIKKEAQMSPQQKDLHHTLADLLLLLEDLLITNWKVIRAVYRSEEE